MPTSMVSPVLAIMVSTNLLSMPADRALLVPIGMASSAPLLPPAPMDISSMLPQANASLPPHHAVRTQPGTVPPASARPATPSSTTSARNVPREQSSTAVNVPAQPKSTALSPADPTKSTSMASVPAPTGSTTSRVSAWPVLRIPPGMESTVSVEVAMLLSGVSVSRTPSFPMGPVVARVDISRSMDSAQPPRDYPYIIYF